MVKRRCARTCHAAPIAHSSYVLQRNAVLPAAWPLGVHPPVLDLDDHPYFARLNDEVEDRLGDVLDLLTRPICLHHQRIVDRPRSPLPGFSARVLASIAP